MTLISVDILGIDEYQERKDNFKKDLKSSIDKKISNFIFLTVFHLVYKAGYLLQVPCYSAIKAKA